MTFAIIILLSIIVLAVAAVRWGYDSRDTSYTMKLYTTKHHAIV
jgi:hypothetical protein